MTHVFWWLVHLYYARCTLLPCPPLCPGGMLMGADNRGIDHGVGIVGVFGQMFEHPLPDATFRPSAVVAVHMLPVAKPFRQVTPWNACPVAVNDRLHKQAMVFCRHANRVCMSRQSIFHLLSLLVPQSITSHHS